MANKGKIQLMDDSGKTVWATRSVAEYLIKMSNVPSGIFIDNIEQPRKVYRKVADAIKPSKTAKRSKTAKSSD